MLDNNIWDWLFKHRSRIDLRLALPANEFALYIPREIEIEHLAIAEATALREFVDRTIAECSIQTMSYFGFATEGVQRRGGFGVGTFIEHEAAERLAYLNRYIKGSRPSGLSGNEADASLANESFSSIVLTLDTKSGPLAEAKRLGGRILYISPRHSDASNLRADILGLWAKLDIVSDYCKPD